MFDIFATFTQAPAVVELRRFSPAEDHLPYRRAQRAAEVADWLAAEGKVLAPTTAETRGWSKGARWMYWPSSVPFLQAYRFTVAFAPRLSDIVERNQSWVDTAHVIMAFERELSKALRNGTSDELDHVSEWLRSPYTTDPSGLPAVLIDEDDETLAGASHHAPGRVPPLSPAQWREGIRFMHYDDANGLGDNLMDRARALVRHEVRRKLEAVGEAGRAAQTRRL